MCLGWCLGSLTFGIFTSSITLFGKLIPWGPASTGKYFTTIHFLLALLGACMIDRVPVRFISWPKTLYASEAAWKTVGMMRIFMGVFGYHFLLALLLVKVESSEDARASIQNGLWPIKVLLLIGLIAGSFLVPLSVLSLFTRIAWLLAFFYLIVQAVLFIDLIYNEAEKVGNRLERAESNVPLYLHITLMVLLYLFSLAMIVLATVFTNPNSIKVVALGWFQAFLQIVLLLLSVSDPIQAANDQAGIYQSGLTCIYSTLVLNNAFTGGYGADRSGLMSTLFLVVILVYAAYNVGLSSRQFLDLEKGAAGAEQIHYNMTFFNLIFAVAAAYAMLVLTNWSYIVIQPHELIPGVQQIVTLEYRDMNFYSKVFSSFSLSLLYGWSLVAPLVMRHRDFD